MATSAIIDSVISLFLMILIGAACAKKKIITEQLNKGLVDILLRVTLPMMILSSFIFTFDESIKANVLRSFYYSLAAYAIMAATSYVLVLPIKGDKRTVLHFANVFTNTGYVGFPVLYSVYGAEGVIYGSVFNMFFVIFVWTFGIMWYQGGLDKKKLGVELKKVLLNPSIPAVCAGLIIMFFDLKLPKPLLSAVQSIGGITGPLSMLIIGVTLAGVNIKSYFKDWTIYYGIIAKLVAIPLIIYLVSLLSNGPSKVLNTVIVMAAMPASTMTSILAERFDKEKDYAAMLVSLTTLLSLLSVTALLKFLLA